MCTEPSHPSLANSHSSGKLLLLFSGFVFCFWQWILCGWGTFLRACWNLWLRPWWWSWRCCCLICKSWVWKERWFIQLPGYFFRFLSLGLFCNSFSVGKIVCGSFWLTSSRFVFLLPTFFILINCVWFLRKLEEQELKHVLRIALYGCFVFIKIERKKILV